MKLTEDFRAENINNRLLLRLVFLLLALAASLILAFGSYYYMDRYVHRGDMSPIELGVTHLEQAVQANPNDPSARLSLASQYIEASDYPGAIEQALLGTPVRDLANPLEVLRVVHSFDPCLSCAVHMLRPGKGAEEHRLVLSPGS